MPVLTAIDVLGIQKFVFASNKLRDVVGASWLVHWVTERDGLLKQLESPVTPTNILMAAGGNTILEFDEKKNAKTFAAHYTRRLIEDAPGLEVVVLHQLYQTGELAKALADLQNKIAVKKTERIPSVPLLGLSVTASCDITGFPATGVDPMDDTIPLSPSLLKCRDPNVQKEAKARWKHYLDGRQPYDFDFPLDIDHLGRSYGETSLMGIVHVDGNQVGNKIEQWLKDCVKENKEDDLVRKEYREWSQAIDEMASNAFQSIVTRVQKSIDPKENKEGLWLLGQVSDLDFQLECNKGTYMLPIRPILLGGDDFTFICDGRIALDLVETALAKFEQAKIPHLGNISASAGIAIVRTHAPFVRAYFMAEGLCTSAKEMLRKKDDSGSALDWHIGLTRPSESVDDIRRRQYSHKEFNLTCRPYRLGANADESRTWYWLSSTVLDDKEKGLRGEIWSERRNKVFALSEIVREGPEAVTTALKSWGVGLEKGLSLPKGIENGFLDSQHTPLLDAVELYKLHLPLTPKSNDTSIKESEHE